MRKALVFSALGYNTGCALRAGYVAEGLRKNGYRVRLVLPWFRSLPASAEVFLSIPIFLWQVLIQRPELAIGIKPYPNCWLALFLVRVFGGRAVADIDDVDSSYRGGFLGMASALSQVPAFWLLSTFSTHHPLIKKELSRQKRVKARQWVWLRQGVDLKVFRSTGAGQKQNLKKRYNIERKKILMFSAHLNIACQFQTLLSWLEPVLMKDKNLCLVVAGGGPLEADYREMARRNPAGESIVFTGHLLPEKMNALVNIADICVSAYSRDKANRYRVPMKLGEYLAIGKPVVTNSVKGAAHLEPFMYVCESNRDSFVRTLRKVIKTKGDKREKKGQKFAARELDWVHLTRSFLGEMEERI